MKYKTNSENDSQEVDLNKTEEIAETCSKEEIKEKKEENKENTKSSVKAVIENHLRLIEISVNTIKDIINCWFNEDNN